MEHLSQPRRIRGSDYTQCHAYNNLHAHVILSNGIFTILISYLCQLYEQYRQEYKPYLYLFSKAYTRARFKDFSWPTQNNIAM